ncbi:Cyclic di-GMP phosphodiesterase YhjH|nr:hypothetical protein [Candidatus Pantoea persica]MBA2817600.1 Cyclic di-GMP phosphodiesterase YhjH [Candidatus Pantoea persica]
MVMKNISHRLPSSTDINQRQEARLFWQQCQRFYTFQPIYQVSGRLLAIEILTAVMHATTPEKRLSPESYFEALGIEQRLHVVHEQPTLLKEWHAFFA